MAIDRQQDMGQTRWNESAEGGVSGRLKIGGVELYRRSRPFFLGLLVGHALGVLLSFFVDQIWFPGQGHHTHSW